ncbi:hypothetical protein Plec18167_004528 [Paecilomyces lecythidis]|uniref:Uncharacterized protein n=1 Tax=Paecilomyces lecythidis TaxID=3004212 RepID=A0ABR3XRU1_9EURO
MRRVFSSALRSAVMRSQKTYFPRFQGVVTDLDNSKFRSGYFNQRAIILEALRPDLTSRRILAARNGDVNERVEAFSQRLRDIKPELSPFEIEYYSSLLMDRIRRLVTLHNLAITHGDIRDEHFRLPGDFYDTVLYDFSISYAFSSTPPYLVNFRKPRSLKEISEMEQDWVTQHLYKRAQKLDLRDHLIQSTGTNAESVRDALFQQLHEEQLEMIISKVMIRPDAFSLSSLSSVFPFLANLCPHDDHTWHIRRGRQLECYESAWVFVKRAQDLPNSITLISIGHRQLVDAEPFETEKGYYLLCLVPKEWSIEVAGDKLLRLCSSLQSEDSWGCIVGRQKFDNY